MFRDRTEAGRLLALRLLAFAEPPPVVLALPRGGVPVAAEIARRLAAPLDLVMVRKIGAPGAEEYAIAAIAEGEPPEMVRNERAIAALHIPPAWLAAAAEAAQREIARRRALWLGGRAPADLAGRTAIVVDDGIATGATMQAALRAVRRRHPARLVLAVPVAASTTLDRLRREADACVVLEAPGDFVSVGQFYVRFPQLGDDEVSRLLDEAAPLAHGQTPPARPS
ncbi:MAG: phosphoribosyltransferase [Rhodospirillales bacterium]|nr:phosphoribosyltransferase [Rhodospirillales bacterium]